MPGFLNNKSVRYGLIGLAVALTLALGFRVLLLSHQGLQDTLVRQVMAQMLARLAEQAAFYGGENLDIVFCGTASPMGNAGRAQQCIAVLAGDRFFIIDSGARSTAVATAAALPLGRLDGVLLTHFHSDHISSLGELQLASWAQGRKQKLPIYGGVGVARVVDGFNMAYGQDYGYRTAHHGEAIMPRRAAGLVARPFSVPKGGMKTIYEDTKLTIAAFTVPHEPISPAVGYRIDYAGRSVVISGDTSKSEAVARASKGADVLIHEVLQPALVTMTSEALHNAGRSGLGQLMADTLSYHTSPTEAADIANRADADMLVFTHFAPSPPNDLVERIFMRGVAQIRPKGAVMAHDEMHIRLPLADPEAIIIMDK